MCPAGARWRSGHTRSQIGLFSCGVVGENDNLPEACVLERLTALQCLEAGHLRVAASYAGSAYTPNLIGHPEDGVVMSLCAKCMSSEGGITRPETAARVCTAEARAQCQRSEDSTGQRVCNLCSEDRLGSVEEGRGYKKGCSLFRGTCVGSVEKRIRGIACRWVQTAPPVSLPSSLILALLVYSCLVVACWTRI